MSVASRERLVFICALVLVACSSAPLNNSKVERLLQEAHDAALRGEHGLNGQKLDAAVKEADIGESSISQMKALNAMAAYSNAEGHAEKCLALYEDARAVGVELMERDSSISDSTEYQIEELKALIGLANHERDLGRFSSALRHYGEARVFHEKLGVSSPAKANFDSDYQKCLSDQKDQEAIEHLVVSGESLRPKSPEAIELKSKVLRESDTILDVYDKSDPASTRKRLLELSDLIVMRWGRDDPTYQNVLRSLCEISCWSGDFSDIDRILEHDLRSMPIVDNAIRTGKHIAPSEIPELAIFIDTLLRQAEVALAKHNTNGAKKLALQSLKLVEQYYPEDGLRIVSCFRRLGEILQAEGDYQEAAQYEERAIALLARAPKMGYQPQHLQMLALDRLFQGDFVQAVNVAEKLMRRGGEFEINSTIISLKLLYEVATSIDDYSKARVITNRMYSILKDRSRLFAHWNNALSMQDAFLDLKEGKFTKVIAKKERSLLHQYTHNFRNWLIHMDVLCYAYYETGNHDNAERLLKKIETTKKQPWQDQAYLSRVTKIRMCLKSPRKYNLDECVISLTNCLGNLGHPSRLRAAESIVGVADELNSAGKLDAAERLYKSILDVYSKVPDRADSTLIDVLKNYHLLLLKQNKSDAAFQTSARWERKLQQFAAVKSEAENGLKSIK